MPETALTEDMLYLDRSDRKLPIFSVRPNNPGPYPSVIIVHEIFGLNEHIRDVARRFARESFCVYAPDLFAGHRDLPDNRDDLNGMRAVWQQIPDEQLIDDLQAVFKLACLSDNVQQQKIGVIGYCMGGAMALMFACRTPAIRWVADYYGRLNYPQLSDLKTRHPIDYVDELQCPVLGLFAGQDELIPEDQILEFAEKLKGQRHYWQLKTYPDAKHAFFNDQRQMYDRTAAADAWKTTLDFIAQANSTSETL